MTEKVRKKFHYLGRDHTVDVSTRLIESLSEEELEQFLKQEATSRQYHHGIGDVGAFLKESVSATGIPRAIELSEEARRGGQALMNVGLEKFKGGEPFEGAWNLFAGALGFTFSPFTGCSIL